MSDKNLLDRWCRLVRIAPNENNQSNERSWVDKSKSLLPIEKKIYAIKVVDNHEAVSIGYQSVLKSKKSKSPAECVRKWIGKCKWRVPKVAVLFSFIQVSLASVLSVAVLINYLTPRQLLIVRLFQILFHLTGPASLAYQTLAFSPICKLELWRYFTYALLHAGTAHLVINIILQLVVALPLESEVGRLNLLVVYVGGIVSGSLAASLVPDFTLLVGSSSGVYSLLMSHIPNIILVRRDFRLIFAVSQLSVL